MKKLLLATTVLVGTAGFAAAEVSLSGSARMGIVNDGDNTTFSSRARVAFALSGETDGGLSFGSSFRADNAGGANSGTAGSVFISGAFGKLEMGDVVGAAEAVVGDLPEIGYTDIANNDTTFITGDSFNGTAPATSAPMRRSAKILPFSTSNRTGRPSASYSPFFSSTTVPSRPFTLPASATVMAMRTAAPSPASTQG